MTTDKNILSIGDKAPDFSLKGDNDKTITLSDYIGQYVVLFIYPKDDTPGCTQECIDFSQFKDKFDALNVALIGLSKDSPKSHDKFIAKHHLGVMLASDEDTQTLQNYGVWAEKMNYGRTYMGADRTTFIIDKDGKIAKIYRPVKIPNHVQNVYDDIVNMSGSK